MIKAEVKLIFAHKNLIWNEFFDWLKQNKKTVRKAPDGTIHYFLKDVSEYIKCKRENK